MSERPALIRQHGDTAPPALLAEWAVDRGIEIEVQRTDVAAIPDPDLRGRPFVASLGSKYSPADREVPAVAAELSLIERAVTEEVPVLGLCYGAQVLAAVLGGRIEAAPEPELGWHRIDSRVPQDVPEGPWLQWHYLRFTLPPGAEELARSPRALQAFASGPHLAVQFHPESTVEIVQGWARKDRERLTDLGVTDGESLAADGRGYAAAARTAAFTLFDAFRRRAHHAERSDP
ncbi:MAG TPA: type 1 glutamine amidotransferase [Solirubrobacteraceae bacterium]|nr:type 1 glutamine amidotransferase [Solirubrobacteraceae bacterium]